MNSPLGSGPVCGQRFNALAAITGNPAAENQLPGTGLAGRLIHLPEDSGLRLGGLWLADTNGLLSLANRVVYLLLKGASFGLAFRWRIGKFLAICNCIEDIFMIFSQGTLYVRFPSPP
jgi:hypothetical protein